MPGLTLLFRHPGSLWQLRGKVIVRAVLGDVALRVVRW